MFTLTLKIVLLIFFEHPNNNTDKTTDKPWEFNRIKLHEFLLLITQRQFIQLIYSHSSTINRMQKERLYEFK